MHMTLKKGGWLEVGWKKSGFAGKFIISEHMNVSRWVLPGMMMRFAWQIAVDFARKL